MMRPMALSRNDVSEELSASIIRVTIVPSSPILVPLDDGGSKFLRYVGSYKSHTA
jgi:hypothetical protein